MGLTNWLFRPTCLVVFALASAASGSQDQVANVLITQLSCDSNPELVSIQNFGGASQNLAGWALRSDPVTNGGQVFDLSVVGTLDPGEQASIYSGSNAPATNVPAGQYRWALNFKFRNGDETDFAQIVDGQTTIIDQLNCGQQPPPPPPPPATSTPTPVPPSGDSDGDGCTDAQELGPSAVLGGLRDPKSFWDFFDTPDGNNVRDRAITIGDIGRIVARFGTFGDPAIDPLSLPAALGYHTAFDRTPLGPELWNLGPPDGAVTIQDIGLMVVQFGHSCMAVSVGLLQVHHIDVGQGDGALIISPGGDVAMIDNGRWTNCTKTVLYLQGLNITSIDYHFASHYHADHIGCLDDLAAAGITVGTACYDRGGTFDSATFDDYVATCGPLRQTLSIGQVITLDAGAPVPVTITVVALDGAGVGTSDENALSLVLKLSYGAFDEVLAGDLTGMSPDDVESVVGPLIGDVEIYKVNHHGSRFSSNDNWLNETTPEVAIISVGSNSFGHPTEEALARLHSHGIQTYWTNLGSGATPDPESDRVGGTIVIEAATNAFSVSGAGFTDSYVTQ